MIQSHRHLFILTALGSLLFSILGCSVPGLATPEIGSSSSQSQGIRQTDDTGKRLPFDTKWPDRWSINNDGTSYEPCTAVTADTLREFKLDPASVEDVAVANHQTARGCRWEFINDSANTITQHVGNGPPLPEYRSENSEIFNFLPDITIKGRPVLRFQLDDETCLASVQSGRAIVHSTASTFNNSPPPDQVCDIAVNFLRATIDKIPR